MKCENCGEETGEDWKNLCKSCFSKKNKKKKAKFESGDEYSDKIIRQSCLKCAAAIFNAPIETSKVSIDSMSEKITELADKFVEWVEQ